MFGFLSSFFSGKKKLEITVEGSLIRYVYGKAPRTISVDTELKIVPGLNDDEFILKVEDSEWDLNKKSEFSVVKNKQKVAAVCWNSEKESVYCIFILSDASRLEDVLNVVGCMLYKSTYGEDPTEIDTSMISTKEFPFNLETLETFEETTTNKHSKSESKRTSFYPPSNIDDNGKYSDEKFLYSCKGDFFLLESGTNTFHEKGLGFELAYYRIGEESRFTSLLTVTAKDGHRVLATVINSTLNPQILTDHNAITFTTLKPLATWGFMFSNDKEVEAKKMLVTLVWEAQYLKPFSSLSEDEQMYILQSYVDGKTDDKGYESEDFMDIDMSDEEIEESEEDEEDIQRRRRTSKRTSDGERNTLLVDSAKYDRAFVVRGEQIGIFDDSDANYLGKINVTVRPEQMILHDNERKLLLAAGGNVKELDLTKEKVVAEYTAGADKLSKIQNIGHVKKYAEQTHEPVFTAMNSKSIWGMDTRISGKSQAVNQEVYSTNPKFKVFSTSSNGQLAVGSEDGIIRLYSGVAGLPKISGTGTNPMRAKTNLPGFGDEIIGLDTSGDGKWVLATCKRYLIVIPTEIDDSTGFEKRMGKRKPSPRRLQLLPEDVYRIGGDISFTPAKFNTGADGETWIITSTGNFVVTWNFRRVRKNYISDYVIKSMHDQVSSDQFLSLEAQEVGGSSAPIIVALDNDVVIEKRIQRKDNPFQTKPRF